MLRFDHFMQQALHHPEHGYYSRKIQTVGADGDFSTTATLSNILGKALAASYLQQKEVTHIIEVGAGDGSLAKSLLKSLPFLKRLRTSYHIVDSSTPLTQQQKRKLSRKIQWHSEIKSALASAEGNAFIFSNELVDAFPVRIFKQSNNEHKELYLKGTAEHFHPVEPNQEPSIYSSALQDTALQQERRIELHESYHAWLEDWLPYWKNGQLITIDYGDTYPELYYRMPHGTLRAYAHHQRITGPAVYQNIGHQDITADVNFTDLMQWGKELGLKTVSYLKQAEYLTPFISPDNEADAFLTMEHGAGSAFKVLIQEKERDHL